MEGSIEKRGEPLGVRESLDIILPCLDGLEYARLPKARFSRQRRLRLHWRMLLEANEWQAQLVVFHRSFGR